MAVTDEEIRGLVYETCLLMDQEKFTEFMVLCTDEFQYQIKAESPELRKEMTWLDLAHDDFANLLDNVLNHIRLPGKMMRQASVYKIVRAEDGEASVMTSLIVIYTDLDGVSRIYASGKYLDIVDISGPAPKLKGRTVWLDTRDLGPGSHVPL